MKKFLFIAAILLGGLSLSYASGLVPELTYQTGISSVTTAIVTVSTSTIGAGPGATQMDSPQLIGRVAVEIQNIDATANLWCLPVSTAPVASGGRKITAGSSWVVSFKDKTANAWGNFVVKFWCISDGAASTKAAVSQMY